MATKATKLPSGNWRVRVQIPSNDSRQHYKSFTAPTRKEVEFMAAQFAYTLREHSKPAPMTVGAAIDAYINARTAVLSPSTIREYRRMRRLYLQRLMPMQLRDITTNIIQLAINDDSKRVSPKTVRNAYGLLTPTLEAYAPDFSLRGINLPAKVKKEISVPEEDAVRRLMVATEGTALHAAIIIEAFCGLRRSEISALEPSDLNVETGKISVTKAMVLDENGQWVLKSPKSYAGTRDVDAPRFVISYVLNRYGGSERVVGLVPDSITNQFCKVRRKVDLICRFHDLRHFTASILLALGVPDKYAMEIMGHATPDMLKRVYQHTMRKKRDEVKQLAVAHFEEYATIYDTAK